MCFVVFKKTYLIVSWNVGGSNHSDLLSQLFVIFAERLFLSQPFIFGVGHQWNVSWFIFFNVIKIVKPIIIVKITIHNNKSLWSKLTLLFTPTCKKDIFTLNMVYKLYMNCILSWLIAQCNQDSGPSRPILRWSVLYQLQRAQTQARATVLWPTSLVYLWFLHV